MDFYHHDRGKELCIWISIIMAGEGVMHLGKDPEVPGNQKLSLTQVEFLTHLTDWQVVQNC
jgi:hypothetical protein